MSKLILLTGTLLLLVVEIATGANKHVLASATGSGSGDDWDNAYTELPAALTRGNNYYIGAGSYPGYLVDDAVSGTSWIRIIKATTSDHGSEVGWSPTFADPAEWQVDLYAGTVSFDYYAGLVAKTSYVELDGGYGGFDGTPGLSSWTNGFGFTMTSTNQGAVFIMLSDKFGTWGARPDVSNIVIKHFKLSGTKIPGHGVGIQANASATTVFDVEVDYLHTDGIGGSHIDVRANPSGWTFRRVYSHANNTTNTSHGVGWRFDNAKGPIIIRDTMLSDIVGTGWIGHYTGTASTDGDGFEFLNMMFFRRDANANTGNGLIFSDSNAGVPVVDNWKMQNITVWGMLTHSQVITLDTASSTNIQAYNILVVNSAGTVSFTNVDDQQNVEDSATDPFVDAANGDFRLLSATAGARKTIGGDYDTDLFGNTGTNIGAVMSLNGAGGGGAPIPAVVAPGGPKRIGGSF